VKKWASVVALAGLAKDQPDELVVTSLVRARFCELVAPSVGLGARAQELFLMGLFSLLDAITGRPMPEVLADLPLADDITLALLGNRTRPYDVLSCLTAYERGEWEKFSLYAAKLRLDEAAVARMHLDCVAWSTERSSGFLAP
jgi:EAL and modified HD-GYP domain-containing signal transduction protein